MVMTIPTSASTSPNRFVAGLAAKALMTKRGLNKIFIVPVAPRELPSQNRPRVGAVSGLIPPQIGLKAANEIGAWLDSVVVKTLHQVGQALGIAAANAKISAVALDLPQ